MINDIVGNVYNCPKHGGFKGDVGCVPCLRELQEATLAENLQDTQDFLSKRREAAQPVAPISFRDWWNSQGRMIDPDTEDVPWFDKREALCEAAYDAGKSSVKFAGAYSAQPVAPADGAVVQRKATKLTIAGLELNHGEDGFWLCFDGGIKKGAIHLENTFKHSILHDAVMQWAQSQTPLKEPHHD
ncbi:MAG: hypothetical protein P4L77_12080 [Sulfuriferula sp.]|nr:hypothetical protein [Sulfuriferula sp.]